MSECYRCEKKIDKNQKSGMCLHCRTGFMLRRALKLYKIKILTVFAVFTFSIVLYTILHEFSFFLSLAIACALYLQIKILIFLYLRRREKRRMELLQIIF